MRLPVAVFVLAIAIPARPGEPPPAPSVRLAGTGDPVTPALSFASLNQLTSLADDGSALVIDGTDPGRFYPLSGIYLSGRGGMRAPVVLGDPAPGGSHFAAWNGSANWNSQSRLSSDGKVLLFHALLAS